LRATIEGKRNEARIRGEEVAEKQERMKTLGSEEKDSLKKIEEARVQAERERSELAQAEEKISSTSKAIEKLFERLKGYENQLEEIGERRGRARMRLDKVAKDFTQVEIKKATTSTRLDDIKSEFSSFTEFDRIEGSRDELSKMVASAERTLATLGNVNMAAIEMYDKKREEIEGVEERIGKLEKEREAILSMINEIEEHKKEAFFETFEAVSDNFRKMFGYVNVGEGHLYLNNPREPFESGLFIKLRRNNQEHSLDALSGGEKTLVALMFIFALQLFKPAPFYILDEVDAALDKPNSKNLADLVAKMSKDSQFILVSHNDVVMANSDSVIGVTKSGDISKLVGLRLKQVVAA
jgi:chromosome segregation protein